MPETADRRITSEQVLEVLQTCYDPCCKERSVSVVELGLIQGVKVAENGHDVRIELLLTSGWCPLASAKEKLTLPMAQLLPLRQRRLEREAQASQQAI